MNVVKTNNTNTNYNDNFNINMQFSDGSIGNIFYTTLGSPKYSKETIIISGLNSTTVVNNFIEFRNYGSINFNKYKLKQDKGFKNQYKHIANAMKNSRVKDNFESSYIIHKYLFESLNQ